MQDEWFCCTLAIGLALDICFVFEEVGGLCVLRILNILHPKRAFGLKSGSIHEGKVKL